MTGQGWRPATESEVADWQSGARCVYGIREVPGEGCEVPTVTVDLADVAEVYHLAATIPGTAGIVRPSLGRTPTGPDLAEAVAYLAACVEACREMAERLTAASHEADRLRADVAAFRRVLGIES